MFGRIQGEKSMHVAYRRRGRNIMEMQHARSLAPIISSLRKISTAVLLPAFLSASANTDSTAVGLNFVGSHSFTSSLTPGPVTRTAGAAGLPQSDWNNFTGASASVGALLNSAGSATGISLTWSRTGAWQSLHGAASTQDDQLMNSYLGNTSQIPVLGITYGTQDVVVSFNKSTCYRKYLSYNLSRHKPSFGFNRSI